MTPTLRQLIEGATPGMWSVPHFADPDSKCQCHYVLCEHYFGAICTIHVANNKPITEGGNDDPPIEEARCNAQLIARMASPEVALAVLEALEMARDRIGNNRTSNYYSGNNEAEAVDWPIHQKLFEVLSLLNGQAQPSPAP